MTQGGHRKISKRTVESAAPGEAEYTLWDSALPGFGLRVHPSGRKSYVVMYRAAGGRGGALRRFTIGPHGEALTASQARDIAANILAEARLGRDPAGARTRRRREPTLSDLCDRYLTEHAAVHNKPSTAAEAARLVEKRIKPHLGKLKVSELGRATVKEWHRGLAFRPARTGAAGNAVRQKQAARIKETPYEANRSLAVLSKIMSLACTDWELRPDNPCRGIRRFPEKKRERFFSASELRRIASALGQAERAGTELPEAVAAIRLLALTGCRLGEILSLRWEHVDLDRSLLQLADSKTGARPVPIGAPARHLLSGLPRSGPFVVPGRDPDRPLSPSMLEAAWRRLRAAAGVPDGRLHDFRHTVGTYGGQAGLNAFLVRDLLGHRTLATTARYVERDHDPIRAAADLISGRIAAAMAGDEARVVPFPGAAEQKATEAS